MERAAFDVGSRFGDVDDHLVGTCCVRECHIGKRRLGHQSRCLVGIRKGILTIHCHTFHSVSNDAEAGGICHDLFSLVKCLNLKREVSYQTSFFACESQLAVVAERGSIQSGVPQPYLINKTCEMTVRRYDMAVCRIKFTTCSYRQNIIIECGDIA